MPAQLSLKIQLVTSLDEIAPAEWDQLAHDQSYEKTFQNKALTPEADSFSQAVESASEAENPHESPHELAESAPEPREALGEVDPCNPFIAHAFLSSLEESGSVGGRSGWSPLHLIARDDSGQIRGAIPVYGKSHSRGEYVFDHAFADAYTRAGGSYYPKLQVSVPFTPANGPRILVPHSPECDAIRAALIRGLEGLRSQTDASSVHATFLVPEDREGLEAQGYLLRADQQFHFANEGYRDFDDFLDRLISRKRKVLKRERRDALANGITIECVSGKDLTEAHWDAFFAFYMDTGNRKWGSPYLNRSFFSLISEKMADKILLVMAKRAGRYIAGALNLIGANTLYGRNWGAIEHHPFLHFELCYYQAMEFAIARRLSRVEAGAQGEHKLVRGYVPVKTWSAHRFADAGFQRAVGAYLKRERVSVEEAQAELEGLTPFRRGPV